MALQISMNFLTDSLSGVLVDTGSSLNVMLKSTLSRLTFQRAPMRPSGVIVKSFDGSRKTVIGEVDLPMTIGQHTFQTLMVSHLSSFYFVDAEDEVGTQFQTLSITNKNVQEIGASIRSFNDARQLAGDGSAGGWGQVVSLPKNKFREGIGFSPTSSKVSQQYTALCSIQETLRNGGFINPTQPETNVVIEENPEEDAQSIVTHKMVCKNWIGVDVPTIVHDFK